ncbi:membrane protein insertase YidC [Spongiivirga citrea]|uniref:Membrane protein insertase YidC n=1 Tax=Spongiivirga citrea TaxID=1481457 RepID=A0A6M0CJ76_9FLAO|nr:membrane protein insertase YidC [Spongiivirga citrea]NER16044.1 membrane protein insertase YidC [Spongiivirga citrea]
MENKKLDINSIIGFVLIFGILMWMTISNQPTQEEIDAEKAKQEQVEAAKKADTTNTTNVTTATPTAVAVGDSTAMAAAQEKVGDFAYALGLPSANGGETILNNELVKLVVSNQGGTIKEAKMNQFVRFDSLPVYLIKDGNADFGITFRTKNGRKIRTQEMPFEPSMTKNGENQVLSMKLKVDNNRFLEYRYEMKPDDYMVDFSVRSQGLDGIIDGTEPIELNWDQKIRRQAKSVSYENRYTRLTYQHDGGKIDKLAQTGTDDEVEEAVSWLSYRQFFFSNILLTDSPFKTASITSEDLVEDATIDTVFTKKYTTKIPLELKGNELAENLSWYYGPTDYKVLKEYDANLDDSIPFGWGIFGIINRYIFSPLYSLLSSFLPFGIAIIVMTIVVRLLMSPVTYKSYVSQAKMKVLKPEVAEIGEKFKNDPMKKQQATMKLYSKAGASPMAGCIPALLQLPVFYSLFMFFPTAFALRQKSFLWAEDLSSYDTIFEWTTNIPIISKFYGNHVSLFPILASVAIFFYMKMTTGQQMASQPTQEGMPDMSKIMKYMIYVSPLFMLIFFNNYASGLSLYYFVSNLLTIGIMLVIKKYIIDEEKIHARIQENKAKPKKQNKFQKRMADMMEQAEAQQKARKK